MTERSVSSQALCTFLLKSQRWHRMENITVQTYIWRLNKNKKALQKLNPFLKWLTYSSHSFCVLKPFHLVLKYFKGKWRTYKAEVKNWVTCCYYKATLAASSHYILLGEPDWISVIFLRNLNSHRHQSLTLANTDYATAFIFGSNTVAC